MTQTYPKLLASENRIKLLEPFTGAKKHHKMQCLVCGHVWSATPISKRQTLKKNGVSGCPNCNNKRKKTSCDAIQQKHIIALHERGIEIVGDYAGLRSMAKKVTFHNRNCGHTFERYPGYVVSGATDCTVCGKQKRTSTINNWSETNSTKWHQTATEWQQYKSVVGKLTEKNYSEHKKLINPQKFRRGRAGSIGAYHLDHIVPKRFCFDNDIPPELCADATNLQMLPWEANVSSRNTIKGHVPVIFSPYLGDGQRMQDGIVYLKTALCGFVSGVMVEGMQATLYNKHTNTAILIIPISRTYANQKIGIKTLRKWTAAGVTCFIIFEDELRTNIDMVVTKLIHYTNQTDKQRIHARQCSIRVITASQKSSFLNHHHIQGNDNSTLCYGAFRGDELVAVMSFSQPNVASGYKTHQVATWELSRFATHSDYRIPGVASKLLTWFKRNNKWHRIISYADRRWSMGNMYGVLGFTLEATNPPSYSYVVNDQRRHRWNYRKDILKTTLTNYDANLTEYQNMEKAGMWRVWDCGTVRYSIYNTQPPIA